MVTVFICLSGENWNEVSHLISFKFGKFYCIFFIMIVMCGNFMLLNLFLAILLKYIEIDREEIPENIVDKPLKHESNLSAIESISK